jgi:hypothetical protein
MSSTRALLLGAVLALAGCGDHNLGSLATDGSSSTNGAAPTCAALGGTCGPAATACPVGQGHAAASATSDCAATTMTCCLPESACPTETFLCCGAGTGTTAGAKTRPLCEHATAATPARLSCAASLTPC